MNRRTFLHIGSMAALATAGRPSAYGQTATLLAESKPARAPDPEVLWLNWNENPLGLAPAARDAALRAVEQRAHRYPDTERDQLVAALAAREGLGPEHVVLGAARPRSCR